MDSSSNLAQQAIKAAIDGDWKQAINLNQRLLLGNPDDLDAHLRLAHALSQLGRIKEAQTSYERILKLDPHNLFASRGLTRLKKLKRVKAPQEEPHQLTSSFLEEPGKTKVVTLVHTASPTVLAQLDSGQPLILVPRRRRISVTGGNGTYIGRLPDDIALRLLGFIKGGNEYQAAIKAIDEDGVKIFIREVLRAKKFETIPSFSPDVNHLITDQGE